MKKHLIPLFLVFFVPVLLFSFGKNKIAWDTFKWQLYTTPHFNLYHYPSEEAAIQRVGSMAESAYEVLARKFNYRIEKHIPLIFYRTHAEFEETNVLLNFIPEGVGAFAEPVRNRMVMPIDLPDDRLQRLIQHELTHIFEFEYFFQGKASKSIWNQPPQWFMEGLASFMAKDEEAFARMILRDAVVNDRIPSITTKGITGYFAYRYGHAAFDFIQDRWGEEGLRAFFYEYRSSISSPIKKIIKRAFDIEPEEFDRQFRLYLRKKYLPLLVATGEPQEYGKPFLTGKKRFTLISPAFAPSGELIAALGTPKQDVDVLILSADGRKIVRNLTPGIVNNYDYLVASFLTVGPEMGRDVAISADGNRVAYVIRKGKGRHIVIQNIFSGKKQLLTFPDLDQERSPVFSPDGKSLAFEAWGETASDIYLYDFAGGHVKKITRDAAYDAAPAFSPDGKTLYYSAEVGRDMQLMAISLDGDATPRQLTWSPGRHIQPTVSRDGKWLVYAWDRETIYNIYRLSLTDGKVEQLTNAVSGCFAPTMATTPKGKPLLIFNALYKGHLQLFVRENPAAVKSFEERNPEEARGKKRFEPAISIAVNPDKIDRNPKFKLGFEDAHVEVGVNTDSNIMSHTFLRMSDLIGNRHLLISLQSVSSYTNSEVLYLNLSHRIQWGIQAYDYRTYYLTYNYFLSGGRYGDRERILRYTGGQFFLRYPFNVTHRADLGIGFESRSINYPYITTDPLGNYAWDTIRYSDDFPFIQASFTGDNAIFQSFGPYAGRRYTLSYTLAPQSSGKPKTYDIHLDFRQYIPFGRRSLVAWRLVGARSGGEVKGVYSFGGMDTMRGYDFYELFGTNIAYSNLEIRFPLLDILKFPFMELRNIRGRLFWDVGAAWFDDQPFRFAKDNHLVDGVSSLGFGFTVRMLGLDWRWDFARKWDFKHTTSGTETSFWIGRSF